MKLTYVVHQFFPRYFSGTEQYVLALAKAMVARGHEVEIFTLKPAFEVDDPVYQLERDTYDGLSIQRLHYWRHVHPNPVRVEYHHPLAGETFGRYLEERSPDLVHVFHLRYLGGNLLEELQARGIPTVVHLMDFWFVCPVFLLLRADGTLCDGPPDGGLGCFPCVNEDLGRSLDSLAIRSEVRALAQLAPHDLRRGGDGLYSLYSAVLERQGYLRDCLQRAGTIVAPSHFLKSVFVENGIDAERLTVVSYGLREERKQRIESARAERVEPGSDEPLRVGYVGTISHYKGVHVVVDAMRHVMAPCRLEVFGRTDDYADYSKPLVERADADERIVFRGSFQLAEVGGVLGSIDVLVVPSLWYENTPFVILEAFAAGVPVFASNLGGMAELVRDGVNGELFERSNAHDLGTRLQRLALERDRLARYRSAIGPVKGVSENAEEIENLYFHHVAPVAAVTPDAAEDSLS
ncbi:MAG: glycosyltransferase family 4 protein [Planctomycetes bacterium]|nr:glycosyltransferase family 4 protein [Planctomycetota bacterium]